jgi:hypothetical protein
MRLFYHPESDSLFLSEPGDWQNSADGALSEDVSDDPKFLNLATLEDIDVSLIEPLESRPAKAVGMAGAITEAMKKWARKPADLYPTPVDCTYSLLPHIADLVPPDAKVWEPACADGQMVRPLEQFGYRVTATDLRPDVTGGVGGIDFLDPVSPYHDQSYDLVATNPPFVAADAFIRQALEQAPVVVMLLKAQYWNTRNRKKLFRETKPYKELNLTWRPAFLEKERGKSPLMDCMWVVWVRGHQGPCTTEMIDRLLECPVNVGAMDMGGL